MLKNIIANFIGRFWSVLSNFLFIPLYIKILGIESYSIISFSLILVSMMGLLDAGMTATLSREFAQKTLNVESKFKILTTLEIIYWGIAVFLTFFFLIGANSIANQFIKVNTLNINEVILSIKVLGIGISLQMLANFYMGGIIGLEYQVKANLFQILWGVFRNGLVILVIWCFPSVLFFFSWQVLVTLIYVLILRQSLIKILQVTDPSVVFNFSFGKEVLTKTKKFAGGMFLISVVAAINTQLDKIAISKLLPIEELGYYTLAIALAQGLLIIINPIATATLPRFTALFSEQEHNMASKLFFNILKIVCSIVFSISAVLIFYSHLIIYIWTNNINLADHSYNYVPYLAVGTGLLAIQLIPFNIAIANGYTILNNYIGISSIFFTIPAYWLSVSHFGAKGAAISWMLSQLIITPIYLYFINKKFLKGTSFSNMLLKQLLLPFGVAILITYTLSLFVPVVTNRFFELSIIGMITLVTLLATAFVTLSRKEIRHIFSFIRNKRPIL